MVAQPPKFDFINTITDQAAKEKEQADLKYRELITKGGLEGKLNNAETDTLAAAAKLLGLDSTRMAADAAAVKRHAEVSSIAATRADAEASVKTQQEKLLAFDAETQKWLSGRQAERHPLESSLAYAEQGVINAEAARQEKGRIERDHWRLLGKEDPSIAARKRHLIITYRDCPASGTSYGIISVQNVFEHPNDYVDIFSRFEFVRADGQQLAEFERLVGWAKAAVAEKAKIHRFIRSHLESWAGPTLSGNCVLDADDMARMIKGWGDQKFGGSNRPTFDVQDYQFIPAPGQDLRHFANLVTRLWKVSRDVGYIKEDVPLPPECKKDDLQPMATQQPEPLATE